MAIINLDHVTGVYPSIAKSNFDAEAVNSYHIPYAQAQIEGLLSTHYTVPFSDNNLTAKDLVSVLTYSRLAPMSEEDRRAIREELYERIDRLKDGEEQMLTDSGTLIQPSVAGGLWSSTEDYHPVFTQDDPLNWEVDDLLIDNLRSEREQT